MSGPRRAWLLVGFGLLVVMLPTGCKDKDRDVKGSKSRKGNGDKGDKKGDTGTDMKGDSHVTHDAKEVAIPHAGFGTTSATEVLEYVRAAFPPDRSPPSECAAGRILSALGTWVRQAGPCRANGPWDDGLFISCDIVTERNGCADRYRGAIWLERNDNSTTDYHLYGQARATRECGRDGYTASPAARAAAAEPRTSLAKFLSRCRP